MAVYSPNYTQALLGRVAASALGRVSDRGPRGYPNPWRITAPMGGGGVDWLAASLIEALNAEGAEGWSLNVEIGGLPEFQPPGSYDFEFPIPTAPEDPFGSEGARIISDMLAGLGAAGQGPAGRDGADGATGAQGVQGEQGIQGPRGAQGPAGAGFNILNFVYRIYSSGIQTVTLDTGNWFKRACLVTILFDTDPANFGTSLQRGLSDGPKVRTALAADDQFEGVDYTLIDAQASPLGFLTATLRADETDGGKLKLTLIPSGGVQSQYVLLQIVWWEELDNTLTGTLGDGT